MFTPYTVVDFATVKSLALSTIMKLGVVTHGNRYNNIKGVLVKAI